MKKSTLVLLLASLVHLALPVPAQDAGATGGTATTMLRLFDGDILWGRITGHDAETLHFERLDNGGRVRVPWGRLDPSLSDELLIKYGYVDVSTDEVMTEADRLILVDGTEIIGKIVNRTQNEIYVKTSSSMVPVPKMRLKGAPTVVQVPALDVFTPEELYQQEVARVAPATAEAHFEMVDFAERIYDFDRALEHLEAARTLGGDLDEQTLALTEQRLYQKRENQEQIEVLRGVDHLRARGKFDEALAELSTFEEMFPDSPLRSDARKKKALVEKSREDKLREKVVERWHVWAGRLCEQAARNPDMSFEAAMAFADETLRNDIVQNVLADLQRTVSETFVVDDLERFWAERQGGRARKASYGPGTFLLGESKAREGLDKGAGTEKEPKTEQEKERKKLADRINKYFKNQELVRKRKSDADVEGESAKFWEQWGSYGRSQWLLAYYAENSGDMAVRDVLFSNCPECNGTGIREVINTGSARTGSTGNNSQIVQCRNCHHVGIYRRVVYR